MKKPKSYPDIHDGEWITVPKRGFKEQCCDCGLVHRLNFRIDQWGRIEVQAFREQRATAAVRRAFKFEKDAPT